MKKKISIIIPFYNEEQNIEKILDELLNFVNSKKDYEFEVILMDNDSIDKSYEKLIQYKDKFNNFKYYKLARNFGYQSNIKAGYDISEGQAAIQLDADGEDDPQIISKFLEMWEKGFDVVYGIRVKRKENLILTLFRRIFYKILNKSANIDIPENAGDFRLVDRKVIDHLKNFKENNLYLRGLISYIGFKQIGIPYERRKRYSGKSKISLYRYFEMSLTAITSFTNKPLIFLFMFGIFIFILSLILIIFYLIIFFLGNVKTEGFTTLILIQLVFFGLQIFILGFFGVYLGYILDEIKNRPNYILDDKKIDKKR